MFQTAVPEAKVGQVGVLMLNLHGLKCDIVSFSEEGFRWTFDPGFLTIKTFIAMPFFAVLFSLFLTALSFEGGAQSSDEKRPDKPKQEQPEFIIIDVNIP